MDPLDATPFTRVIPFGSSGAIERVGGDPCLVRSLGVLAAGDDSSLDALATIASDPFDVEDAIGIGFIVSTTAARFPGGWSDGSYYRQQRGVGASAVRRDLRPLGAHTRQNDFTYCPAGTSVSPPSRAAASRSARAADSRPSRVKTWLRRI